MLVNILGTGGREGFLALLYGHIIVFDQVSKECIQ